MPSENIDWAVIWMSLVVFLPSAFALVLILPIPFCNMLPAAAVSVFSLALIQRDGVIAMAGYAVAAASVGVLVLAANLVSAVIKTGLSSLLPACRHCGCMCASYRLAHHR